MKMNAFFTSDRGSVATMAGLLFVVVLGASGAGLDFANAKNRRTQLQSALDASVLAAATMDTESDAERMAMAKNMFLGSYFCQSIQCGTPAASMNNGSVVLTADAQVETSILKILGWDSIDVAARAQAQPASFNNVEVVMMLDYSGSMSGSNKYQNMAAAATQFLDSADARTGDHMSVGIVPFSEYVLTPMDGSYLFDVDAGTDLTGSFVVGCVLNREHPYSVSADTPSTGVQGSLWPVFSYVVGTNPAAGGFSDTYGPSAPKDMSFTYDGVTYTVRYIDYKPGSGAGAPSFHSHSHDDEPFVDPHIHGWNEISMTWVGTNPATIDMIDFLPWDPSGAPYGGYGDSENWNSGDDSGLPPSFSQDQLSENLNSDCSQYADRKLWVRPLSKDFTALKTAISGMSPIGLTNIALSLDIGWHMLTAAEPFTEVSTEEDTKRVAILLTDGVQTVKANGAGNITSVTAANGNVAASCQAMKDEGIEIFTIAFGISDTYTRELLRNCASSTPHYFEPAQGGELDDVFEGIFNMIAKDSVRLTG